MNSAAQVIGLALARDLDRRLAHVPEPAMRRSLLREALLAAGPAASCELLAEVERRPPRRKRPIQDCLREALRDLLLEPDPGLALPYRLRSEIYAHAREREDGVVMDLLRSASDSLPPGAARLPRELSEIPLGRRRSLALGDDARLLELLARDVDPVVIEHLLRNPRIREPDVVRIAALRPVAPSTLEQIFRSERWSHQPRIRVALARNPYCPVGIAMRLVGSLPLADLREMRVDPGLHDDTRAAVLRELERRAVTGSD